MNDTTPETQANSPAKVLTALAALGEATAAAVAERAGLGYSTTTPKLRALEDTEQAERFRNSDGRTLWRLTPAGRAALEAAAQTDPDSDPAATSREAAKSGQETAEPVTEADPGTATSDERVNPSEGNAETGTPQPPDDVTTDVSTSTDDDRPVDTLDGSAARSGGAPRRAPDGQPDQDTPQTGEDAHDGPHPDSGQTPSAQPDNPGDAAVPASAPADQPTAGQAADSTSRRSGGTLRGAILDILEAHPDQQYKISELCKLIDKANEGTDAAKASAGAVANAVVKLVGQHKVIQTVERPATFQLAATTD